MKSKWLASSRVLTIIFWVLCGPHVTTAADFSLAPSYATGKAPTSLAVGDLNGDGKLDLVVANSDSNTVSVLLGNGDGTFQTHVEYSVGKGATAPSSVALGDFNGDGKLDLVVANASSNNVSVLLGNGDGTFQAVKSYYAGAKPSSVATADFNGDGKLDLAVADQSSNKVSVLLGKGDGTFSPEGSYGTDAGPIALAVADFNGDHKLDLAVANGRSNDISVLLGNGDGTFAPAVNYDTGKGSDPLSVITGDFNGDGKPDLAVANNVEIWVSVLLGNGDGTFQPAISHEAGTSPTAVAAGDFNGDGKLDLAVSNNGSNTLTVLLGNGDGTLQWVGNFDAAANAIAVEVGDFNGDGKLDAVVVNELGDSVSIFLGNGDGTVVAPVSYGIGGMPEAVAVGAFGTNGVPDMVASNGSSGSICTPGCVSVITGKGNGTFNQLAANYDVESTPKGIAVGEFDGDGEPDVVVTNSGSTNVSVLLNTGGGTFGAASSYPAGISPVAVSVADFNGDTKLDLAVVNAGTPGVDSNISILLGNGDGSFGAPVNYGVGIEPSSVAVGDLNGDGKFDLAVTNKDSGSVSVLMGNGDGMFQPAVNYQVGTNPTSVVLADFNGDGKLDLGVANAGASSICKPAGVGTVSVLLGNGDGTFQPATNYCAGVDPLSIAEGDVNGDGKADLVVADGGSAEANSGVSVLLGKGDGTFRVPVNYGFGNICDSVAIADLNGDGAPDLAVTSVNGGVTVLLNPGGTLMTDSSSPNPSSSGQTVTFTATVARSVVLSGQPAPTGLVVFDDGQTAIGGATLVSGAATFATSSLSIGTHTITAVYSGDVYFSPNVAPSITQTVTSRQQ